MRFTEGRALPGRKAFRSAGKAWADLMQLSETLRAAPDEHPHGGMPLLTPETWRRRDCRGHHPRECVVCAFFADIDMLHWIDPYRRRYSAPSSTRWRTAEQALADYLVIVADGYPSASPSGAIVTFGRLGTWTQQGGRKSSQAETSADDAVVVELALRFAFDDAPGWRACAAVVLARRATRTPVDAGELAARLGIASEDIDAIVRQGMRGVRADLAARGLIERPRRGSRAFAAMVARMQDIGRAIE